MSPSTPAQSRAKTPAPLALRRLRSLDPGFDTAFSALLERGESGQDDVGETVRAILRAVRTRGDEALLEYTNRFDRRQAASVAELELGQEALQAALARLDPAVVSALHTAAGRIRLYAEHQRLESWSFTEPDGTVLGQQVSPLDRVGIYVPGGKAAYPSSVLMNAIPAKVAGVGEIVMVVPAPEGELADAVLAAAAVAGVDRVFTVGGAQAVAALAYGTASLPAVDKIVGPGNIYVATAKAMVFGTVGIDMIAGPSEVLVLSDGRSDPEWVAMDLFAQAEHDEGAQALLISPDAAFLDAVAAAIERLLPGMERADIIRRSLQGRGALIEARDMDEAIALTNRVAPEHLEISADGAADIAPRIRHAGAIFLGQFSAEAIGDYCAGPNHVLPTAGTARFSSPLGVYDFQKRSSLVMTSRHAAGPLGHTAAVLARAERLDAHARAAQLRAGAAATPRVGIPAGTGRD